ncbi:MAG: TRAP transporter small permease [Nitrospirota bacterium]
MKKLLEILNLVERFLGIIFFIGLFGSISIQVFSRYILRHPLTWPTEFSIYCYIYIVYIGAVLATREGSHVGFDIIYERFSKKTRLLINIFGNIFVILLILTTFSASIDYIKLVGSIKSSAMNIPWSVILISFPIGMGMIILHLGIWTTLHIREFILLRKT